MDLETLPLPGLVLTALLASGLLCLFSFSFPPSRRRSTTSTTTAAPAAPATEKAGWHVAALYVYPIKSCRGISLRSSAVVATGLQHDRQFTFAVRESGGDAEGEWGFITQRQYPLLSQVSTSIEGDGEGEGLLSVSWPTTQWWWWRGGAAWFSVPLSEPPQEQETLQVRVWVDVVSAWRVSVDKGKLAALKMFLQIPAELELELCRVREQRKVLRCAPRKEQLGWQVVTGFADSYPMHLLSLSSVAHLGLRPTVAAALGKDLSPQRFRANIIVDGPPAFDEDAWKRIEFGGSAYTAACRTVRCKLPNVDPDTGIKHPVEPDHTMRKYRNIDAGAKNSACLGMHIVCDRMEGATIAVGDTLKVLERGEHFYIHRRI